ncbi:unnamed protein product, partial [Prorocentrum cordatum]
WLKAGRLHLLLVRHSGVLTTGLCSEVARARAPTEMINGQLLVGTRGPPLPESACAGCRRPTPGPAACPEPAEGGALASGRAAPSGAPLGSSGVHQRLVASLSGKLQHVLEQHEHAPVHDGAAHADRSQQGLAGRTSRASLRQSLSAAGLPFPGRLLLLPPGARAARRRPQQGAGRCRRPGGGGPIVARGPCRWPWSPRRLGRPLRTRSRLCPQLLVLACPGAALADGAFLGGAGVRVRAARRGRRDGTRWRISHCHRGRCRGCASRGFDQPVPLGGLHRASPQLRAAVQVRGQAEELQGWLPLRPMPPVPLDPVQGCSSTRTRWWPGAGNGSPGLGARASA